MDKETLRQAIESNDYSTARGRNDASGKEINPPVRKRKDAEHSKNRACGYLNIAEDLKTLVAGNFDGVIEEDELESVEFILEQIEKVSLIAYKKHINARRKAQTPRSITANTDAASFYPKMAY